MKTMLTLLVASLLAVGLAGCTDDGSESTDGDNKKELNTDIVIEGNGSEAEESTEETNSTVNETNESV